MPFGSAVSELTAKVAELYREIVTTSVRFENLQHNVAESLARLEDRLRRLEDHAAASHADHVRDRAALAADIRAVDLRLTLLSEHALHVAAREATREAQGRLGDGGGEG